MKQFLRILGLLMVLVYAGCGFAFLFLPDFMNGLNGYSRYVLGALLVIYGGFRGYRVFKTGDNETIED